MFFGIFTKNQDGGPDSYIHAIAVPLISMGIAILAAPSFRDILLQHLNKLFQTKLDFAQTPKTGFALLTLGLLCYAFERLLASHRGQPLLTLRHQSFLPLPRALSQKDLPLKMSLNRVQSIDCDLYAVMNATPKNVEAALSIQAEWAIKAVGTITSLPDAPVAYYGIVHIPFQFLAGYRFSTFKKVHLFELDRRWESWRELNTPQKSTSFALTVDRTGLSGTLDDVAIRISISYTVHKKEVAKVLLTEYADIHLRLLPGPRLDAVESCADIHEVCSVFRNEIDKDEVRNKRIHIFYSGPVSLGFALGQQISPSIHGEVHIYNYDSSASPAYSWSIQLAHTPKDGHVRRY